MADRSWWQGVAGRGAGRAAPGERAEHDKAAAAGSADLDIAAPGVPRWAVVQSLVDHFDSARYLEVGVSAGGTFHKVRAPRKVAVDPVFRFDVEEAERREGGRSAYYQITSDVYFGEVIAPGDVFDVIYLDGLHTFEQTLRDLLNALEHLAPRGVILIDDVRPSSYPASLPDQNVSRQVRRRVNNRNRQWMGDVYRLVWFIDTFCQQLSYRTVGNNHGQAVVWRERRTAVTERPARDVAELSFADLLVHEDVLRAAPLPEILELLADKIGRR